MTSNPYAVGTISVPNGGTTVTGVETYWIGAVRQNDYLFDPAQGLVARVTENPISNTELAITPWAGTTLTDAAYEIISMADSTTSAARLRDLLAQMSVVEANGLGVPYRFSDTVTDGDPSAGYFRFDNADPALATAIYIDNLNANGGAMGDIIDRWDDSTSIIRGTLLIQSLTDKTTIRAYSVTGSVVDGTGYRKLTVTYDGGSGSFAADDEVMLAFIPTGDQGDSFVYDVRVDDDAALAAYDDEDEGFVALVLNDGSGRSVFKTMGDGGSGDWQITAYLTGPRGVQPRGAWLTATEYVVNDLVGIEGSTYICVEAHTSGTFATDLAADKWELFVEKGDKGAQRKGPWLTATAYVVDDVVRQEGSAYICLEDHTSGTFSIDLAADKWELFVEKGGTGATGATGGGLKGIACRVVAEANVAIATGLEAGDAIDGVTLASGDLVLLAGQSAPAENGVYIASVSGPAARHADFDAWADFPGSYFPVCEGTDNADTLWRCTSNAGGTLGTTALVFEEFSSGASSGSISVPALRLTLTSGVAVMQTSVAGATTVYATPVGGGYVPLYDGTALTMVKFAEVSQATTDTTKSPAAVAASKVYDLFAWDDAGTKRVTRGPAWTSDTVRGYDFTNVDGILVNASAITNGPAAERGTWIGTIASNAASTIDYILGAASSGGTAAVLNVWNAYNRVPTAVLVIDNGAPYTYASSTIRQARGSSGNRISFVVGAQEDGVSALYSTTTVIAASGAASFGVGFDSVTTYARSPFVAQSTVANSLGGPSGGQWRPGIGPHYISALEASMIGTTSFNTQPYTPLANTLEATIWN